MLDASDGRACPVHRDADSRRENSVLASEAGRDVRFRDRSADLEPDSPDAQVLPGAELQEWREPGLLDESISRPDPDAAARPGARRAAPQDSDARAVATDCRGQVRQ